MTRHARFLNALILGTTLGLTISAGAAHANNISFVSTAGKNANPCTLNKPCRSLQRVINATPEGGEIRILDSGFFGKNATINKSLTVNGNGNTIFLGADLVVNAGGVLVALRNLTLDGRGKRSDGIRIAAPATLHIERCVFHGFADDGISVNTSGADLFVIDSTARDNGDAGLSVGSGNSVRVSNSTFTNNETGIDLIGTAIVESRGNNTIRGNTTQVEGGALTPFNGL